MTGRRKVGRKRGRKDGRREDGGNKKGRMVERGEEA
jgi:hypothetical protein